MIQLITICATHLSNPSVMSRITTLALGSRVLGALGSPSTLAPRRDGRAFAFAFTDQKKWLVQCCSHLWYDARSSTWFRSKICSGLRFRLGFGLGFGFGLRFGFDLSAGLPMNGAVIWYHLPRVFELPRPATPTKNWGYNNWTNTWLVKQLSNSLLDDLPWRTGSMRPSCPSPACKPGSKLLLQTAAICCATQQQNGTPVFPRVVCQLKLIDTVHDITWQNILFRSVALYYIRIHADISIHILHRTKEHILIHV